MLSRPGPSRRCRAWPRWPRRRRTRGNWRAPDERCTRSTAFLTPRRRSSRRRAWRRTMPRSKRRSAICSSRNTTTPKPSKSYQRVLELDPRWAPALVGAAHALENENPPQAAALVKRALEINPNSVDAHVFLANQAIDSEKRAEARELLNKALAVNPSSLDVHGTLAALAYVEDKPQEFEAEVAKVLAISPGRGEVYRVAGEMVAHNYRFDEAVVADAQGAGADAQRSARAGRPRRAAAAHGRRGRGAFGARGVVQDRPVRRRHLQRAAPARLARQVRDDPRRRSHRQVEQGRSAGPQGIRHRARAPGAQHDGGEVRVHAEGARS